ncbi:hypothetical protein [Pacificimonas pallii]|nr:hypothetical protein [Pacificimonas pallii]
MTEEEQNKLRDDAARAGIFATIALFIAAIALALSILGLFMPLSR